MRTLLLAGAALLGAAAAAADPAKVAPGFTYHDGFGFWSGTVRSIIDRGMAAGTLRSLPSWSHRFSVAGTPYNYTLLGSDPAAGAATTVIPTVLVPIRLTVTGAGDAPLVFDMTPEMPSVIRSPIFTPAKFASGRLQFTDAMLHMEFPKAPKGWHLILSPSVAATIDVQATRRQVRIMHTQDGTALGVVTDGALLQQAIGQWISTNFSPDVHPIFFTLNVLVGGAFGYHSGIPNKAGDQLEVFTYTSWLEGAGKAFGIASPNADTLAHEEAEVVHDAFGTSKTRYWGDWFNNNKCFQPFIEVGDAVEDASGPVQNYREKTTVNGHEVVYTLQSEALLPWFERQYPSPALHNAYSFPNETALLGPAPLNCAK